MILYIIIIFLFLIIYNKFKKIPKNNNHILTIEYIHWKKLYYKILTLKRLKKIINKKDKQNHIN